MRTKQLESIIEAILFTMGDSVEVSKIASAIEQDVPTTEKLIHNMMDKYQKEERGIRIIELDHAYQLCSKPEMYEYLIRIAKQPKKYIPRCYAVLAAVSSRYSPLRGRLLTRYSPVRH